MVTLSLLLIVAAFILFLIAAIGVSTSRFNLVAAGLACWALSHIVGVLVK
jgi:hypothetical protein